VREGLRLPWLSHGQEALSSLKRDGTDPPVRGATAISEHDIDIGRDPTSLVCESHPTEHEHHETKPLETVEDFSSMYDNKGMGT
jgi:hypothetical protein